MAKRAVLRAAETDLARLGVAVITGGDKTNSRNGRLILIVR